MEIDSIITNQINLNLKKNRPPKYSKTTENEIIPINLLLIPINPY